MDTVFRLPDLGEGLHEAEIVAWQVGVGDHVVADQPLVSVETDKAVVEIPSPRAGRIAALHGAPGDVVPVGAPLVEFESGQGADKGAIVGEVSAAPASGVAASRSSEMPPGPAPAAALTAAPAVRRRAAELGIDLAQIRGSGPSGAVSMADLEAAAASARPGAGEEDASAEPRTAVPPPGSVAEKLRGVRRAMHRNMSRAGREVVRATVTDEVDIHDWPADADLTIRLVRAMVAGCRASPSLNAWFDAASETRTLHDRIDVGLAFDTGDALYTPVLRDAGARSAEELREMLESLKGDVASRSLPRDALTGQTITLSNFGTRGGRFAELVVLPPQVAILGAGRAAERVVPIEGRPAVRRMLPLSLSFDHRVVTGAEATRFLNAVIEDLRKPL